MAKKKFSVVIPYKGRLRNLRVALTALSEQTLDRAEFEVVVGSLDAEEGFHRAVREFGECLDLTAVTRNAPWNFSQARNLGLRHVTGEIVVLLDADMALPPDGLESLYRRYFAAAADVCVLGQLVGMDGLADTPQETEDLPEHRNFRQILTELGRTPGAKRDPRWHFEDVVLPWTMVWTGFVALPAAVVHEHDLLFDENFTGWGAEDQEWGYRVARAGLPIVRGEDVFALHLPHVRNVSHNMRTFDVNKGYFLTRWPTLDVQLYRAFDSWSANRWYEQTVREVAVAVAGDGETLGVARGQVSGTDTVVAGLVLDAQGRIALPLQRTLFDADTPVQILPLVGFTMPFPDRSVAECRILPALLRLGEQLREAVLGEAERVAGRVVTPV